MTTRELALAVPILTCDVHVRDPPARRAKGLVAVLRRADKDKDIAGVTLKEAVTRVMWSVHPSSRSAREAAGDRGDERRRGHLGADRGDQRVESRLDRSHLRGREGRGCLRPLLSAVKVRNRRRFEASFGKFVMMARNHAIDCRHHRVKLGRALTVASLICAWA
jgi:hypothetical protein